MLVASLLAKFGEITIEWFCRYTRIKHMYNIIRLFCKLAINEMGSTVYDVKQSALYICIYYSFLHHFYRFPLSFIFFLWIFHLYILVAFKTTRSNVSICIECVYSKRRIQMAIWIIGTVFIYNAPLHVKSTDQIRNHLNYGNKFMFFSQRLLSKGILYY